MSGSYIMESGTGDLLTSFPPPLPMSKKCQKWCYDLLSMGK